MSLENLRYEFYMISIDLFLTSILAILMGTHPTRCGDGPANVTVQRHLAF